MENNQNTPKDPIRYKIGYDAFVEKTAVFDQGICRDLEAIAENLRRHYGSDSQAATIEKASSIIALLYPVLGLCGEAGEVADKFKKIIRGDRNLVQHWRLDLAKELGDVLWYTAATSHKLGYTLEEIKEHNIEKLRSRQDRGVLKGSGDNR